MADLEERVVISRVLVTFDTFPLGQAALEAAAGLASGLGAELAGLFVEDINLMRMAELPFARELGLSSAAVRRVEAVELERALRLQAERVRTALAEAARELQLQWSFQVVRGAIFDAVFESVREMDLVVFGKTSYGIAAKSGRSMPPSAAGGEKARRPTALVTSLSPRPVIALYDRSPAALRALAAGLALARTTRTELVLLIVAADAESFVALRGEAEAWLAQHGQAARYLSLPTRDASAIGQAVRAQNGAALLWYAEETPVDRRAFSTLVSALDCPVVLVV